MCLKLNFVKGCGYETYNTKEKQRAGRSSKSGWTNGRWGASAPVPLVILVDNILHSIFRNVEVCINSQQICNSNGLYAHKSYIFNNFSSEYKKVLLRKRYDCEEFPDKIMEAPLSEPLSTRRATMLKRPDDCMLYGELGIDFSSTSDLLYPNMKNSLGFVRAGPSFHIISDNPNVNLGMLILHLTLVVWLSKYHKERMDMFAYTPVEFNYSETPARTIMIPLDKTSSSKETFSTVLKIVALQLRSKQTLSSLDCTLKINSGINKMISDKIE